MGETHSHLRTAQRSLDRIGMTQHPDLDQEQAYVDRAYECLDRTKEDAWRSQSHVGNQIRSPGGCM